MNWYKVTLTLRGPSGTPWQADTIFGHLCWALRHRQGEGALRAFLQPFRGGNPTFLLSDGFPGELLPRPLPFTLPHMENRQAFKEGRELRQQAHLTRQDFIKTLGGQVFEPEKPPPESLPVRWANLKNQISRLTGTTGEEGNLFGFIEHWMPEVTLYLKIQEGYDQQVKQLLQWLAESGYGKRKSVGYGAIGQVKFEPFEGFPMPQGANAFVSLSHFVPSPTDPAEGRWRLEVKYGKLGEDFATGANPFKRPLVMLKPGTVLRDAPVREFYGRMVTDNISAIPEVVQYGYALPVPMLVPQVSVEVRP